MSLQPPIHRQKILWIKSGPVTPPNTGGRLRTYRMLKELNLTQNVHFLALGAEEDGCRDYAETVEFVPFEVASRRSLKFVFQAVKNLLSKWPLSLELYQSVQLQKRISQLVETGEFDLVVCDFLTPAPSIPRGLRGRCVIFQHNIEAQIWQRMAEAAGGFFKKAYMRQQHRRMQRAEGELCGQFQRVITVSADDSRLAVQNYGLTNVAGHVPTGVDAAGFAGVRGAVKEEGLFCFLGSMDWMPNIDGVEWLLAEVWPLVRERLPQARLRVIGRNPPREMVSTWQGRDGVEFTGTVEDIRPHLAGCQTAVVPLRVGGGTRLKILELMAAGIPVVATAVGAEGLPVVHEKHYLRAEGPLDFSAAMVRLANDGALAKPLADDAHAEVVMPNSWAEATKIFLALAGSNASVANTSGKLSE